MFCQKCGTPIQDGAKYCSECGYPTINAQNPQYVQLIKLRCKNCNGVMTVDPENNIVACKYCGSKELIIENSSVTIERIKSKTARDLREIDYKQHESEKELEREKLYYEENRTIRKEKRDWKTLGYAYLGIFLFFAIVFSILSISEKKEISSGKILIPSASEAYIGEKYYTVELELQDAGFTNITSKPLKDLSGESKEEQDIVYKIMIDGDTDFSAGWRVFPDVNIFIYYHSLSE